MATILNYRMFVLSLIIEDKHKSKVTYLADRHLA